MKGARDCACRSGLRYTACCAPVHRGEREPETASLLVRARYAAFALALGGYLARTLATEHADHGIDPAALTRDLVRLRGIRRFLGVAIWHESTTAATAEVLFHARMFEHGRDVSLVELSDFRRESGAWRYESGRAAQRGFLPNPLTPLTREEFLAKLG